MPPSAAGKLDEISLRIGEMSGYIHEHRHGVNNLSLKFDAMQIDVARRVEALDAKMTVRIDEINTTLNTRLDAAMARIEMLEGIRNRQDGARGIIIWLLQSPLVGWIAAAALFFSAWWTKGSRP
jgi:hypothetical protein